MIKFRGNPGKFWINFGKICLFTFDGILEKPKKNLILVKYFRKILKRKFVKSWREFGHTFKRILVKFLNKFWYNLLVNFDGILEKLKANGKIRA